MVIASMDLITGDGGFDFSIDFNKQEYMASTKLIFAQICFAIFLCKKNGGTFILKIFDIFSKCSIDILYILSNSLLRTVILFKPKTSRIR